MDADSVRDYPPVVGEFGTITEICRGKSISRYGDGELKAMDRDGRYTRELQPNLQLVEELRDTARNPHENCLIGIPTMDPQGTKYPNWSKHKNRFVKYFHKKTGIPYYSSLITRPDCGDWLETREYYEHVIKIWAGKSKIAVVSESDSKLLSYIRLTHEPIHIECPMYGAYAEIDRYEREVVEAKPDIALLSLGVTATCLANRLSKNGIQAVDLGSIGGFLCRWYAGDPQPVDYALERGKPKGSWLDLKITPQSLAAMKDKDSKQPRFRKLYEDMPFINAYAEHTNLRVQDNPKGAIGREDEWESHGDLQLEFLRSEGLKPDSRLLDVGCGVGRAARKFVPFLNDWRYTGIDISDGALAHATGLANSEGWASKHPTFILNEDMNLLGAKFDMIWAHSVFTHLPPQQVEVMIGNASRLLERGGKFLFTHKKAERTQRNGLKQFQYPPSWFQQTAAKYGLRCEVPGVTFPAGQHVVRLS